MSRSSMGKSIKHIFMQQVFCGMSIHERDRQLQDIIDKHSNEIFDGNSVNRTIKNIIGLKRSEYMEQLRKKIYESTPHKQEYEKIT